MPVKSRSKTFKPGESFEEAFKFFDDETDNAVEWDDPSEPLESQYIFKKRCTITITYDRDDKTE